MSKEDNNNNKEAKDKDKPIGYYVGSVNKKKRFGRFVVKAYPDINEQKYSDELLDAMK